MTKHFFGSGIVGILGSAIAVNGAVTSSITTSPSPTTTPALYSNNTITAVTSCASDGLNAVYSGYSTDPAEQCLCIARYQSWYETTDPATRTYSRTIGIGLTTTTFTSAGSTYTSSFANLTTLINTAVGNQAGADGYNWYGTAEPPCCSSCTIAAATVEVFYFPTPAISGAATSFVSNGVTFVSPSVYIGFSSLGAYDFCGSIGGEYLTTTMAFNQDELSSLGVSSSSSTLTETFSTSNSSWGSWKQTVITTVATYYYTGPATLIDYRDLAQNCSTISGYTFVASEPYNDWYPTNDPCHPTILLPSRVKSLDPAWASCVNNPIGGFYDPPYALSQAAPLVPVTTTSASPSPTATLPSSTAASPGSTTSVPAESVVLPSSSSTPALPTSTSSVVVVDPTTSTTTSPVVDPTTSTSIMPVDPTTVANSVSQSQGGSTSTTDTSSPSPAGSLQASTETTQASTTAVQNPGTTSPGGGSTSTTQDPGVSSQVGASSVTAQGTTVSPQPGASTVNSQGSAVSSQTSSQGALGPGSGSQTTVQDPGAGTGSSSSPSLAISVVIGTSSTTAAVVVGSQTVQPGSAVTVSGTTISLATSGGVVVVNGQSTTLPATSPTTQAVVIGSQTIVPGSAAVISGTTFSVASSGGSVFINGSPTTLPSVAVAASTVPELVIGSTTLIPGSAVTISGTTYSIASTGGSVIVNGIPTSSPAIGSIIMSIISPPALSTSTTTKSGSGTATSAAGPVQVTGNAGSTVGFEGSVALAVGILAMALVL